MSRHDGRAKASLSSRVTALVIIAAVLWLPLAAGGGDHARSRPHVIRPSPCNKCVRVGRPGAWPRASTAPRKRAVQEASQSSVVGEMRSTSGAPPRSLATQRRMSPATNRPLDARLRTAAATVALVQPPSSRRVLVGGNAAKMRTWTARGCTSPRRGSITRQ